MRISLSIPPNLQHIKNIPTTNFYLAHRTFFYLLSCTSDPCYSDPRTSSFLLHPSLLRQTLLSTSHNLIRKPVIDTTWAPHWRTTSSTAVFTSAHSQRLIFRRSTISSYRPLRIRPTTISSCPTLLTRRSSRPRTWALNPIPPPQPQPIQTTLHYLLNLQWPTTRLQTLLPQ